MSTASSKRDRIRLTETEVDEFLAGRHVMNVATVGHDGRPHLVAMWYGFTPDGKPAFHTYGTSQKVVNLRRDPRVTALVETGERYAELKGVELIAAGRVIEDREVVQQLAESTYERYLVTETGPLTDEMRPLLHETVRKRVAVVLDVERVVSWDHSKL